MSIALLITSIQDSTVVPNQPARILVSENWLELFHFGVFTVLVKMESFCPGTGTGLLQVCKKTFVS